MDSRESGRTNGYMSWWYRRIVEAGVLRGISWKEKRGRNGDLGALTGAKEVLELFVMTEFMAIISG